MYDYNARFYSPLLGRFISADSIVPEPGRAVHEYRTNPRITRRAIRVFVACSWTAPITRQRIAVRQNGVPYHLDTDHLGSTILVTVAGGEVARQE